MYNALKLEGVMPIASLKVVLKHSYKVLVGAPVAKEGGRCRSWR